MALGWLEVLEAWGWGREAEGVRPGRSPQQTSELQGLRQWQHREARLQGDKSMPPDGGGQWRDPGCSKDAQNGGESRGVWRVKRERDTEWCLFPRQQFPQCWLLFLPLILRLFPNQSIEWVCTPNNHPYITPSCDSYTNTHVQSSGVVFIGKSHANKTKEKGLQGFTRKSQQDGSERLIRVLAACVPSASNTSPWPVCLGCVRSCLETTKCPHRDVTCDCLHLYDGKGTEWRWAVTGLPVTSPHAGRSPPESDRMDRTNPRPSRMMLLEATSREAIQSVWKWQSAPSATEIHKPAWELSRVGRASPSPTPASRHSARVYSNSRAKGIIKHWWKDGKASPELDVLKSSVSELKHKPVTKRRQFHTGNTKYTEY